ncbi:MAG TPA: 30S ribosomal protein S8 [Candidatus Paceibacterota bacterium]|nr:30S ribosomal protein S8 [Candidatus Paceibacterota bacterium]
MDPISDMLTRITNAQAVRHATLTMPFSKMKLAIATLLVQSGYLTGVERTKRTSGVNEIDMLELALKYDENKQGAISGIRLISRPSRHLYAGVRDIRPVRSGFGMSVMSTPKGIMSGAVARKEGVGGELLFEIW